MRYPLDNQILNPRAPLLGRSTTNDVQMGAHFTFRTINGKVSVASVTY